MKGPITLFICIVATLININLTKSVYAWGMMGNTNALIDDSAVSRTAQEETEGKDLWNKIQQKEMGCTSLTDDNFQVLGEYYMGQALGNTQRHAAMNQMMKNMMGEDGEIQMHIALGKRFSGCDISAPFPENGRGFIGSMSGMMGGGGSNMMNWGGLGFLTWIPMLAFWLILILALLFFIRYMGRQKWEGPKDKTPLDILKERYAKGEINKQEYEEKKSDLI